MSPLLINKAKQIRDSQNYLKYNTPHFSEISSINFKSTKTKTCENPSLNENTLESISEKKLEL